MYTRSSILNVGIRVEDYQRKCTMKQISGNAMYTASIISGDIFRCEASVTKRSGIHFLSFILAPPSLKAELNQA